MKQSRSKRCGANPFSSSRAARKTSMSSISSDNSQRSGRRRTLPVDEAPMCVHSSASVATVPWCDEVNLIRVPQGRSSRSSSTRLDKRTNEIYQQNIAELSGTRAPKIIARSTRKPNFNAKHNNGIGRGISTGYYNTVRNVQAGYGYHLTPTEKPSQEQMSRIRTARPRGGGIPEVFPHWICPTPSAARSKAHRTRLTQGGNELEGRHYYSHDDPGMIQPSPRSSRYATNSRHRHY